MPFKRNESKLIASRAEPDPAIASVADEDILLWFEDPCLDKFFCYLVVSFNMEQMPLVKCCYEGLPFSTEGG